MQRNTSSSRASNENYFDNLLKKSMENINDDLPLYVNHQGIACKRVKRYSKKWIHIIPVIVFLCLFVLWWCSHRVDIVMKDGRITYVRQVDLPMSLNETHIDLTSLASAIPPYGSVDHTQTAEYKTAAEPEGKIDP